MIYLDYSANALVDPTVLYDFREAEQTYIHTVPLDTLPGYKQQGQDDSFLEAHIESRILMTEKTSRAA